MIRELVGGILGSPTSWIDRHGTEHAIGLNDILIIAPYNAQVFELQDRIPGARIGTVDKFAMLAWRERAGRLLKVGGGPHLIIQDELHLIS